MPKAVSRYKQVRITLTEEPGRPGSKYVSIGVRVMIKPLNQEWHMKQTVFTSRLTDQLPLETMDAVYEAVLEFLQEQPLPESPG